MVLTLITQFLMVYLCLTFMRTQLFKNRKLLNHKLVIKLKQQRFKMALMHCWLLNLMKLSLCKTLLLSELLRFQPLLLA
ncbi:MAG: hypothetical protein CME38_14030 [Haliea sp.]|nr:hypothetical protein [Haliea sp.]